VDALEVEVRLRHESTAAPHVPSVDEMIHRGGQAKWPHWPLGGDWIAIVRRGDDVVFDSRSISLHLVTESAARWLAALVRTAIEAGVFAPPKGANVPPPHRAPLVWTQQGSRDFDDDSVARLGPFGGHVEWTNGPKGKGGDYFFNVWRDTPSAGGFVDLNGTEVWSHLRARSADAGRFLVELVMDVAGAGYPIPPLDS
jgi:hypothetical protein